MAFFGKNIIKRPIQQQIFIFIAEFIEECLIAPIEKVDKFSKRLI